MNARRWFAGAVVLVAALGGASLGPAAGAAPAAHTVAADGLPESLAAITLVHADDVRGNLTLPVQGPGGATYSWSSGDPAVVTATGEVTRPATGSQPVDVTLTVTGTLGEETATRDLVVHVQPQPAAADHDAYAFAYFAGESTDDGEKIYFGASKGDDPLDYDELNDGAPVLSSDLGEKGLRDPFIIRSHEGDRFFLLATDLKIYGGNNFSEAQESGSKSLMIWESTDLVNWSEQREVKVSSDFAGNTWAPEAYYDEASGEYVVYWASNLYDTTDESTRSYTASYNRMMYATTRDFVTFSEAQPWIDVKRGTGRGMIDATVVRDGDTFYRVVKDEASFTVRQERSTDLRATVTGSLPTSTSTPGWQLVKERLGAGQPNPWGGVFNQGEGPTVFRDNDDPDRWYMFIDQPSYHGGRGYLAFQTDDIGSATWTSVPSARLPSSPRHGTVIPVSQAELDAMRAAYQPDLLISTVTDVAVSTRQGTAPALPATVAATLGDETTTQVAVEWDPVAASSYAAPGTFQVEGTVTRGSADRPVATVTVTDPADPVVTLTGEPDGLAGWWVSDPVQLTVAATDDTGVASVETSLDDGPWTSTSGSSAEATTTGDGEHEVAARAVDTTGNRSAAITQAVRIDATAPVSRATYDDERRVTVRAADATSRVDRVQVRVGAGQWTTYVGPVAAAGETVAYRAVDRAGNVETTHELVVPAVGTDLLASTVLGVTSVDRARFGSTVTVTARVNGAGSGATGTVRLLSGGEELASGRLVAGALRLVVDTEDLGVGRHPLVLRYDGDEQYAAGEDTVALTVTRAVSTTSVAVSKPARNGTGAVATVRVSTNPAGQAPDRVRVTLTHPGTAARARWVVLSAAGRGRWALPRLQPGVWRVTATTAAGSTLEGSTARARVVVR